MSSAWGPELGMRSSRPIFYSANVERQLRASSGSASKSLLTGISGEG